MSGKYLFPSNANIAKVSIIKPRVKNDLFLDDSTNRYKKVIESIKRMVGKIIFE